MLPLPRRYQVIAYTAPADMRKGFDTLSALIREGLGRNPTNGDLYLFVSRNRIRAKVILWDGTGSCLYVKRLEKGHFACLWKLEGDGELELSHSELALFLEGSQEVGRRRLSPPPINPDRPLLPAPK